MSLNSTRDLRSSTRSYTKQVAGKSSEWNKQVFEWIEKSQKAYKILISKPPNILDYKRYAKMKFFDLELTKVHPEKMIHKIVNDMNEKSIAKFVPPD